jgi:uncharacterized protein (DUF697 family)
MVAQIPVLDDGIQKAIHGALDSAFHERGHFNIIIAGRTGVGKSTLINAVFEGNFAETGQGKPVTQTTKEITKEGIPLSVFDSKGLEMADYKKCFEDLEQVVAMRKRNETDPNRHIHAAWLCIHEDSRRVEPAEIELHDMLSKHMPVIGVITKARADGGFRGEAVRLLPKAASVMRVRALKEVDDDGQQKLPMGLKELVEATINVIPDAAKRAFAAAQRISIQLKKEEADKIVLWATGAASTVAVSPIPFSDAALIVPVQITMLAKISSAFGLSVSDALLKTLLAALVGTTGATIVGRAIVANALKFIPGIGTAVGGVISAATAAAITAALGKMYIAALEALCAKAGNAAPTPEDIAHEFKKQLGQGK